MPAKPKVKINTKSEEKAYMFAIASLGLRLTASSVYVLAPSLGMYLINLLVFVLTALSNNSLRSPSLIKF